MATHGPASLRADRLMAHMRALCETIGPRPPTSPQERQAADYVITTLRALGVEDVQEQRFKSQDSYAWIVLPYTVMGALAPVIAALGGRWGQAIGGLMLLGEAYGFRSFYLARPPIFQPLIARGVSQNVMATLPPSGPARRTLFLIGHLDTNRQRFLAPWDNPGVTKPANTGTVLLATAAGLSMLAGALRRRRGLPRWQWLVWLVQLMGLRGILADERQPHIEGANDNATAVSVLLGVAEALHAHPLKRTEVKLLFTGCEEAPCVGIEAYLRQFAPPAANTYWIDLEMVGTGHLCYITRHGISHVTEYAPSPEMVACADRVARQRPELGVTGKAMLILEEVANLVRRGYRAVCVAGYNDQGFLPNWHRVSDQLSNIEPDTLSRAARFTWALAQEIDALPTA